MMQPSNLVYDVHNGEEQTEIKIKRHIMTHFKLCSFFIQYTYQHVKLLPCGIPYVCHYLLHVVVNVNDRRLSLIQIEIKLNRHILQ